MSSEEQRARNEGVFRNLNERVTEIADRLDTAAVGAPAGEREEFFCECGRLDCMDRIGMSREEYENVRGDPARFLVATGHEDPELETVVRDCGHFVVVEKHPDKADLAIEMDPRSGES